MVVVLWLYRSSPDLALVKDINYWGGVNCQVQNQSGLNRLDGWMDGWIEFDEWIDGWMVD